jgi:hypothetical protein
MKKNYTPSFLMLFLFILGSQEIISQVGIGTTTPRGALDVVSSTQGFIPPQVALTATNASTPVVNPQGGALVSGTIVYNTATAGTSPNNVIPGYYYWDGTIWVSISGGPGGKDWNLLGNAATNPANNFIGTTDAVDFVTRTSNTEKMRVTTAGNVGIGTTTPGNKLDVNGGASLGLATGKATFNSWWPGNTAFWIDLPTTGPSGIGTGGAGVNPWFAYVSGAGQWFLNSSVGDHAYRNVSGKLLFGNTSGNATMALSGDKLGIGTVTPSTLLEINNGIGGKNFLNGGWMGSEDPTYASIYTKNTTSGQQYNIVTGTNDKWILADIKSGGASRIVVTPTTGYVGIGTDTPANKLEITQGTAGNSGLRLTNLTSASILGTNATGDIITATANPSNGLFWGLTGNAATNPATNFIGTTDAVDFVTRTNSTEKMRVTSGGNIGIGINNPTSKLHIYETTGTTLSATAGTLTLEHGNSGGQSSILFKSAVNPGSDYGYIRYSDDGSGNGSTTENSLLEIGVQNDTPGIYQDDIALVPTGNVGIGNTTPKNKLEITQGTAGNSGLRFTNLLSTSATTTPSPSGKLLTLNANGDIILVSTTDLMKAETASKTQYGASGSNVSVGTMSYENYDGNWSTNLVLPASAPYVGFELTVYCGSTFNTVITTANTDMGANATLTTGNSKHFKWGGAKWQALN